MRMIDRIFEIAQDAAKLSEEKSFFKRYQFKTRIKKNKNDIMRILNKKEFDVQDIYGLGWIIEFGKVKWPNKDFLLEGSEVNYFDGPYITIKYHSKDLSINISTAADYRFEINITSKKVTQHRESMHIDEDSGILELVREILTYPITEIIDCLIEGGEDK